MRGEAVAKTADAESRIVEAAAELLAAQGVKALSMRTIADRVGVTATAIYHYFEGKQDLVQRVVEMGFRRFGEYMRAGATGTPEASLERIIAMGEAYIRFAMENRSYFQVLLMMEHEDSKTIEELPEGRGYPILRQAIVDAMDAGNIRRADPDLVAVYFWSYVHGLVNLVLSCKMDKHKKCEHSRIPTSPFELYRACQPFLRAGLEPAREKVRTEPQN